MPVVCLSHERKVGKVKVNVVFCFLTSKNSFLLLKEEEIEKRVSNLYDILVIYFDTQVSSEIK